MKRQVLAYLSLCLWATSILVIPVGKAEEPFRDVTSDNPFYTAISYLQGQRIVEGYGDSTFRPNNTITRAEFVKIIMAAITAGSKGTHCFSDVTNQWFAPYVCEAKKKQIINGYENGTFKPNEPILFSEASKVVAQAFRVATQSGSTETWFQPFVEGLAMRKAIPLSIDYFDKELTRGDMAEMVYRLKANITKESSRNYDELQGKGVITVSSCEELQDRLAQQQQYPMPYYKGRDMLFLEDALMAPTSSVAESAKSVSGDSPASSDFSQTNVQVKGVDEADIIKNDGKYIYVVKNDTVRIVEAYPANNLKELVRITLGEKSEHFSPMEMYVDGNMLVVMGTFYSTYSSEDTVSKSSCMDGKAGCIMPPQYNTTRTKVFVLDITDKMKPVIQRTVEFEGNYQTSRKIGNRLYMIMNHSVWVPWARESSDVQDTNIIPMMKDSKYDKDEYMTSCNKVVVFPKMEVPNYLIVASIPLNDATQDVSRTVIVAHSENVYASKDAIYVASTQWSGGYRYMRDVQQTMIYKFSMKDGTVEYVARGSVPGNIINQFSMDESDGYFRIATTKDSLWNSKEQSSSGMYILDKQMQIIGKITGIAPGEKIYSTRFMGEKAYMVTFKHVDPLFVLDLSEPTNPRIMGQLKIPGYSTYLHPYDENHIIGFGNDVDENIDADKVHSNDSAVYYTAVQGLKLGMFDVSDVTNPKELFTEIIGTRGTTSDLLYNHKALLFDASKHIMAFPVTVYDHQKDSCSAYTYSQCPSSCQKKCVPSLCNTWAGIEVCTSDCDGKNSCVSSSYDMGDITFVGAYVYDVDLSKGFQLKGKISHFTEKEMNDMTTYVTDYSKVIQRIITIGENFYTVSQAMVKANSANFSEIKAVIFGE